jgi:hypothetical protein
MQSELKFGDLLYRFESRSMHCDGSPRLINKPKLTQEVANARVRVDCVLCLRLGLRGTGPIHRPNVSDLQPMRRCWGLMAVAERQSAQRCRQLSMPRHWGSR